MNKAHTDRRFACPWKVNRNSRQITAKGAREDGGDMHLPLSDPDVARAIEALPALLAACEAIQAFDPGIMFPMRPSHVTPQEWRQLGEAIMAVEAALAAARETV